MKTITNIIFGLAILLLLPTGMDNTAGITGTVTLQTAGTVNVGRNVALEYGHYHVPEYQNPYYLVCFDPLITNIVLTLTECGRGLSRIEPEKDTERRVVPNNPVLETVVIQDTPAETLEVTEPAQGNPGNDKSVGRAGEKCEKDMCELGDRGATGKKDK